MLSSLRQPSQRLPCEGVVHSMQGGINIDKKTMKNTIKDDVNAKLSNLLSEISVSIGIGGNLLMCSLKVKKSGIYLA